MEFTTPMNHTDNTTTPEAAAVPPAADTPSAAAAAEATAAYAAHSAPASHGAAEEGAAAPSLEQRLSELEARHAEVSDAYLRAKAETENVRRRSEEEVAKARKFAVEAFAESLLPVKDSLEAAIATPNATAEQVLEGVQVTLRQLSQALERNKVVEVAPPAGTRFDPHQHQAISMVPADQEANTVVTVLQKGYLIAERVLRPALVTVAAPK